MSSKSARGDFQKEHQRLIHALLESVDRECALHQQLRGLKEALVSSALRLHVTSRIGEEDGAQIAGLKQEALEAKTQTLQAEKKASMAVEIVNDLNVEINLLKKAFRDTHTGKGTASNPLTSMTGTGGEVPTLTDQEVDEMMLRFPVDRSSQRATTGSRNQGGQHAPPVGSQPSSSVWGDQRPSTSPASLFAGYGDLHRGERERREEGYYGPQSQFDFPGERSMRRPQTTSSSVNNSRSATPFQQWKIEKAMWSPDTPAGSANYEEHFDDVTTHLQLEVAESFRDFQSLQRPKSRGRISAKVFDPTGTLPLMAPHNGSQLTRHSPMTFDSPKRHLWGAPSPPPAVPSFRSKQEMQAEQARNGHARAAHMMISRQEAGKGPIPPKSSDRIKSKLFQ